MDWSHQTVVVVIFEVFTDGVSLEINTLLDFFSNLFAVDLKITELQAGQNFREPFGIDE